MALQSHNPTTHRTKPPWVPGRQVASQEVHTTICKVDPLQPEAFLTLRWKSFLAMLAMFSTKIRWPEMAPHKNSCNGEKWWNWWSIKIQGVPLFREKNIQHHITSCNLGVCPTLDNNAPDMECGLLFWVCDRASWPDCLSYLLHLRPWKRIVRKLLAQDFCNWRGFVKEWIGRPDRMMDPYSVCVHSFRVHLSEKMRDFISTVMAIFNNTMTKKIMKNDDH